MLSCLLEKKIIISSSCFTGNSLVRGITSSRECRFVSFGFVKSGIKMKQQSVIRVNLYVTHCSYKE